MTVSAPCSAWPSLAELAADVGEGYHTVYNWHRLDSVPRWHWPSLLKSAERQGIRDISQARLEALDRVRHAPRKLAFADAAAKRQSKRQ